MRKSRWLSVSRQGYAAAVLQTVGVGEKTGSEICVGKALTKPGNIVIIRIAINRGTIG